MNYQLITSDSALERACTRARACRQIALDTEFVRTRTYYPRLGLIQLFDGEFLSLIDPLTITAWQPFVELLRDQQVIKFLHAGSEDLEVFLNAFSQLPIPMLDTQILAAFTGRPLSSGFATLVAEYQQVILDKSEARTDWMARPLTEKQCTYAAADVLHLLPIALQLVAEVESAGYLAAVTDECQLLCRRRSKQLAPELAYLEISNAWQLGQRQLACLQKLAAWRLRQARERDLAVNFVVREEHLWQVARYLPTSLGELATLGLSGPEIRYHGKMLLALVVETNTMNEADFPPQIINLVDQACYRSMFKAVKGVIQQVSEKSGLNSELLASRRQINQLLSCFWQLNPGSDESELLNGWRGALMGEALHHVLANN